MDQNDRDWSRSSQMKGCAPSPVKSIREMIRVSNFKSVYLMPPSFKLIH